MYQRIHSPAIIEVKFPLGAAPPEDPPHGWELQPLQRREYESYRNRSGVTIPERISDQPTQPFVEQTARRQSFGEFASNRSIVTMPAFVPADQPIIDYAPARRQTEVVYRNRSGVILPSLPVSVAESVPFFVDVKDRQPAGILQPNRSSVTLPVFVPAVAAADSVYPHNSIPRRQSECEYRNRSSVNIPFGPSPAVPFIPSAPERRFTGESVRNRSETTHVIHGSPVAEPSVQGGWDSIYRKPVHADYRNRSGVAFGYPYETFIPPIPPGGWETTPAQRIHTTPRNRSVILSGYSLSTGITLPCAVTTLGVVGTVGGSGIVGTVDGTGTNGCS